MEHHGIEYALEEARQGWRWSVKRGHDETMGTCEDRDTAIERAQRVIDERLGRRERAKTSNPEPSRASHFS